MNVNLDIRMSVLDYIVVIAVIVLSTTIGAYYAWRSRKLTTTRDFLLSNSSAGLIPLILSAAANSISPGIVLGQPAEAYNNGLQVALIGITSLLAGILTAYSVVPVYFCSDIVTVYQYLEKRFNRIIRRITAVLYLIRSCVTMASMVHLNTLVMSDATGIPYWTSMGIFCGSCGLYTSLGGFSAVIWTDVIQISIIFVSIVAIVIKGTISVEGVAEIWNKSFEGGRTVIIRFSSDHIANYSTWSLMIGGFMTNYASYLASQTSLQRQIACKNLRGAKMTVTLSNALFAVTTIMLSWIGLILYARYQDCDPLLDGKVKSRDQIIALFVKEIFNNINGLQGLFVAGILASSFSTLSSVSNAFTAVIILDFVKPFWPSLTEKTTTIFSKVAGIIYFCLTVALTVPVSKIEGFMQFFYTILGSAVGPTSGVFMLGFFFPWATSKGAASAFICSILLCWWAAIGRLMNPQGKFNLSVNVDGCVAMDNYNRTLVDMSNTLEHFYNQTMVKNISSENGITSMVSNGAEEIFVLYRINPIWYGLMAIVTALVVGIAVSFATGARDLDTLDLKLISPFTLYIMDRLPADWIKSQRFKTEEQQGNMIFTTFINNSNGQRKAEELKLKFRPNEANSATATS